MVKIEKSLVLLIATFGCGCSHPDVPPPKGWLANEGIRQMAWRCGSSAKSVKYSFYLTASQYVETDPARVNALVSSLTGSIRRETIGWEPTDVGAAGDKVRILDGRGSEIVTFNVPPTNIASEWGPAFAKEFERAKRLAKQITVP